MTTFDYGPVEFYAIGFDGDHPGPGVLKAIDDLVKSGTVNLLDLVFVRRSEDGELDIIEFADTPDSDMLALELDGLAGEEDVTDLAADLPPGSPAAILVVELAWAKAFSQALYDAGGAVIGRETVPAPVVNLFLSENEN
ncbi:MAG: DUF6325 family protein [Microbacterium sp.]